MKFATRIQLSLMMFLMRNWIKQSALNVHEAALGGHFPVRPADTQKCKWCEYRDTCRVESIAQPLTAEVGE